MDENEGQRRKRFHGLRAARRAQQPVVDERKPNVEKQLVELKAKAEIETHLLRSFFYFFFFLFYFAPRLLPRSRSRFSLRIVRCLSA